MQYMNRLYVNVAMYIDCNVAWWTPPPPACLLGPPPPSTHVEEVSSNDSLLSDSSNYNDECLHVELLNVHTFISD
jgi:hypothetical protein